jgi:hypothetical protein
VRYQELIPMLLNELQHQQRELEELRTQNASVRAALEQQTAAVAARLDWLGEGAARPAALAGR